MAVSPWQEQAGDRLKSVVENLQPSEQLQAKLQEAGIAEIFESVRRLIISLAPYNEAMQKASGASGEYRDAVSRAIVAQAMSLSEQQYECPPILTNAALRNDLIQLFCLALEGYFS